VIVTRELQAIDDGELRLANASLYLEAAGHIVLAWIWLDQYLATLDASSESFYEGKRQAARYFFRYELPHVTATLRLIASRDRTTLDMTEAWF
jgi:hypothetical protein